MHREQGAKLVSGNSTVAGFAVPNANFSGTVTISTCEGDEAQPGVNAALETECNNGAWAVFKGTGSQALVWGPVFTH